MNNDTVKKLMIDLSENLSLADRLDFRLSTTARKARKLFRQLDHIRLLQQDCISANIRIELDACCQRNCNNKYIDC